MGTKRIYEIAKETNLSSKEVQDKFTQLGISLKSASSSVSDEQYDTFRQRYSRLFPDQPVRSQPSTGQEKVTTVVREDEGSQVKERITERRVSGTVIRRRSRLEEAGEAPLAAPAGSAAAARPETQPAVSAAPAPSAEDSGGPRLRIVEQVKTDFVPRVEQPVPQAAAPGEAPLSAAALAAAAKGVKEREERERAERKVAKTERKVLLERQADSDWRETKRTLAKRREFEEAEVIPVTERAAESPVRRPRRRKQGGLSRQAPSAKAPLKKKPIRIEQSITLSEMAGAMGIKSAELIRKLLEMEVMATANQAIDAETAGVLATEYGFEIERVGVQEGILRAGTSDTPEQLQSRPPVVTIMGHVDHGKTTLLDKIRSARVAEGEAGGITQHIGAYHVKTKNGPVTFLDTPGHQAFTEMRARGAKATDLVVLVVAADDGVMPQTLEAVSHAKAANVPIIVAVNKIDKPGAKPDQIRSQLSEHGLAPEEWGGQTLYSNISAKTGQGVPEFLEQLALQAEILELKANPNKPARGLVIEAKLERGRGPVATVLVQEGTLHLGDAIVAGPHFGRVRAMLDDLGRPAQAVGPGMPVELFGLSGVPSAGDPLDAATDEKLAKQVAEKRAHKIREAGLAASNKVTLEQLFSKISQGESKELAVVLKADVQGSEEAIAKALNELSTDRCRIKIIHEAVGGITESDVMLAAASGAIVLGFNVRPDRAASETAERQQIQIKTYSIIYNMLDEVRAAMQGLLEPEEREHVIGHVEVREVFNIGKVGKVAGCLVQDGKVTRSSRVRVVRDGKIVYTGQLASLKRFKDDAREVQAGMECGLAVADFADVKAGDSLEVFEVERVAASLGTPLSKVQPAGPPASAPPA